MHSAKVVPKNLETGDCSSHPLSLFHLFASNPSKLFRTNLSAGAARPNPQGSFRYGLINVTRTYLLRNMPPVIINGKLRTTLNGISYSPPTTPLRLADHHNKTGVYTLDFPTRPLDEPPRIGTSVINGSYRGFMEIVFQNDDTRVQTYHIDGYSVFVVGWVLQATSLPCVSYYIYVSFAQLIDRMLMTEWTMGSGQRTVETITTSGTLFIALRLRYLR